MSILRFLKLISPSSLLAAVVADSAGPLPREAFALIETLFLPPPFCALPLAVIGPKSSFLLLFLLLIFKLRLALRR